MGGGQDAGSRSFRSIAGSFERCGRGVWNRSIILGVACAYRVKRCIFRKNDAKGAFAMKRNERMFLGAKDAFLHGNGVTYISGSVPVDSANHMVVTAVCCVCFEGDAVTIFIDDGAYTTRGTGFEDHLAHLASSCGGGRTFHIILLRNNQNYLQ